ncbi:MAG: HTTM domain-containing protein [Planctomycetes bacterium]|nr:HTTM domain-containing protein [Planctomycetota bacterium]MBL6909417.1 HTTM domain-containing protein [Pirellulales bacterium]
MASSSLPFGIARLFANVRSATQLDSESIAAFRIAAGCVLVADALLRSRDFWLFFSPEGIFPLNTLQAYLEPGCWSLNFLNEGLWWQGTMLAAEAAAGLSLIAGYFSSVSCFVAWIVWTSILRRTEPAANAGDYWMACLLYWGMFLPLGDMFSIDSLSKKKKEYATISLASAAFLTQVLVVYLYAGISKLQGDWLNGSAVGYVLSVHDHGTWVGEFLNTSRIATSFLTASTLLLEIVGPLLFLFCGNRSMRRYIAFFFILFHIGIWITLSVGMFSPIGITAWIALIPWRTNRVEPYVEKLEHNQRGWPLFRCPERVKTCIVITSLFVAGLSLFYNIFLYEGKRSHWVTLAINALTLEQPWGVFERVGPQEQWVTGKATLKDASVVDLLRQGRSFQAVRPPGGFSSLPNHRWHKIFWELPKTRRSPLREPIAAGLVADWNRRHSNSKRVQNLEIYFTQVIHKDKGTAHEFPRLNQEGIAQDFAPDTVLRQWLLASWPQRGVGSGNLDRFLEETRSAP